MANEVYIKKKTGEKILISSVTEYGSDYIRLDNGTQICYGYIENTGYDTIVKYPVPFVKGVRPFLIVNPMLNGEDRDQWPFIQSYPTSSEDNTCAQFKLENVELDLSGSSVKIVKPKYNYISINYIAIGRWK